MDFLRDASRAQLIETFVPEAARPWAVSRYSADRNETREALEQAQTLPMLAPRQIVFLHDLETPVLVHVVSQRARGS
jgi:hypothetical protein